MEAFVLVAVSGGLLDDERADVIASLNVVLVVGAVAEGELLALPAAAVNALQ